MQTPEPSLETNQDQVVSGEEPKLEPSIQQTEHPTETTPEKQEKEQQHIPPDRAGEAVQERPVSYSEEDILKGLVYPPPPIFYENMQPPAEQPTVRQTPPTRYVPEAARAATSYVPPKTPYLTPASSYASTVPARPASPSRQAPVKKSRTWVWVVVTIMAVALIASGSLCGWAAHNVFSRVFQEVEGIGETVDGFYGALQSQNYTQAYSYLALTGTQQTLTKAQFIQIATQEDSQYGPVLSYKPGSPSLGANSQQTTSSDQNAVDINHSTVTVQVGRKQKQYTVTLTLRREGNTWKIIAYNQF